MLSISCVISLILYCALCSDSKYKVYRSITMSFGDTILVDVIIKSSNV